MFPHIQLFRNDWQFGDIVDSMGTYRRIWIRSSIIKRNVLEFFSAEKRVSRLACGFAHFVHPIIPAVQLLSARGRTRTSSSYKGWLDLLGYWNPYGLLVWIFEVCRNRFSAHSIRTLNFMLNICLLLRAFQFIGNDVCTTNRRTSIRPNGWHVRRRHADHWHFPGNHIIRCAPNNRFQALLVAFVFVCCEQHAQNVSR